MVRFFLALWDFSRSSKHCIQLSTTNTIYISLFVIAISAFRSSRPELFCKKGVLKNFAKFTGISSGTGVSCEFFAKHLQWQLLAFAPVEISYSNTVCNKSAAEAWICLVSFYGGAKDFIFTCIFLRIITIFIKIWMWHCIFSISVTGLKFNTWKTIIHLITASNNSQNICSLFTS